MQDKQPHSDFDPQLLDRGWELLRPQLDAAMPVVEERRRRGAYWWWLAFGLLALVGVGAGATYTYWNADLELKTPAPVVRNTMPIAVSEQSAVGTVESEGIVSVTEAEMSNSNTISEQVTVPASLLPTQSASWKSTPTQEEKITSAAELPTRKQITTPVSQQTTREPQFVATIATDQVPTTTEEAEGVFFRRETGVDDVAIRPVRLLDYSNEVLNAVSAATIPVARAPRLQCFASSRLGVSLSEPHYSQLGLGVEGQVALSRKWQLAFGLHYQQSWPAQTSSEDSDLVAGGFGEELGGSVAPSLDNVGRLNVNSSILAQLHTRQLGLEVRGLRRLSPRWQIGVGGELLYYLAAYLRDPLVASPNVPSLRVNDDFDLYNDEVQVISNSAEDIMQTGGRASIALAPNRWQGAATAGVQYQLHANWQLGLDWRKQLTPWSSTLPDLQTQSTLQLRLRYRLR